MDTTRSIWPLPKTPTASFMSIFSISTLSSSWFNLTDLEAISATSSWISIPIILLADDLPASKIGIIPVPVPRSTSLAFFLTLVKLARRTASIPKQKHFVFCMILSPLNWRSSILSFSNKFTSIVLFSFKPTFLFQVFSILPRLPCPTFPG